ncbi:Ig-like domain-containing protein [Pleionea sediminis]|uniref:Ig-like domain-containing protein n=1 Tax=Pleionea sediminis TaxID=2569479 RepID=UPI001185D47D|nr:Ig-like domain-containing protein [Pleionea sediminis]
MKSFLIFLSLLSTISLSADNYTRITSPQQNSVVNFGSNVQVMVDAEDDDGVSVARLWLNGSYQNIDTSAPFQFTLDNLSEGEHRLMVRTKDNKGNATDSETVVIQVVEQQPYTIITAPTQGAEIDVGEQINVTVDAFDPNGVSVARLWLDGTYYGIDQSPPFNFNISELSEGEHTLMVRVKSTNGQAIDSEPVTVQVINPQPYTEITSPSNGTEIENGESFMVSVDAFDPDGIEALRLWIDDSYYDIDQSPPFEFMVSGLSSGDHSLMVRTRDINGEANDSDVVLIRVKEVQSASTKITSPANESSIQSGERLLVTTNIFDPEGIKAVRLWINGSYHSLDKSEPYQFSVDGLSIGTHTLVVRSKNSSDQLLDSAPVIIHVVDNGDDDGSGGGNTGAISLPVEVFGPSGTTQQVSFELNNPDDITHLYLRCNACGYHDVRLDRNTNKVKASVRINDGSPIALKHFTENGRVYGNSQINVIGGEADYGGIGGGFRTVRMTVPINGLRRGQNVLTFEHKDAENPSIGFRIIDLNLLRNGNLSQKVWSENDFNHDNPADWEAPRSSVSEIAEGASLWRARNRLYDPWLDSLDGRGNGSGSMNGEMRASCADCHAEDGRDLKYFNFSNESIIERSKFHGLTQAEGEKIASYIRSLNIPVVDQARPWNPAYQPGPGLDNRPVYEWAAGAGVDAILDRDQDIAPYLFPNGTLLNDVRRVVDRYGKLNFRELPMNMPMPEWNQWLPIVHPDDAFDINATAIRSDYRGRNVGMPYYKKLYEDARSNPNPSTIGALARDVKQWFRKGVICQNGDIMRAISNDVLRTIRLPIPNVNLNNCNSIENSNTALHRIEDAKRGLTAWTSVKMWEIMHSMNLEEQSATMTHPVCSDGRCVDGSEPRGWVADGRNVFDRPPHFTGTQGRFFFSQSEMLGIFESSTWYHLNMILNTGYRRSMPSHFAYTYSHVELLQRFSGIPQGFKFWATMIKQRQLQTNGRYGVEAGLDLRTAQPYVYYGTARRTTNTDTQSSVGRTLWRYLIQAMLEDFVEDANNATAQDWANATHNRKVQPRNSTDFSPCGSRCSFDLGQFQGRNTYRVIPKFRELGVPENVLSDLIDWCEKTWPRGPWNDVR